MNNEGVISTEASKVTVRVITTNEEVMIAMQVNNVLKKIKVNNQKMFESNL